MTDQKKKLAEACRDVEQDLVVYYYGECEGKDRARVERHLEGCPSCRRFLEELRGLLPLTVRRDEPDSAFWDRYSSEIDRKLAASQERRPWWREFLSSLRGWPVPALAAASVLILALTLTLTKRLVRSPAVPPEEQAVLEIMGVAENLEFFKAMEFLDTMDLLETLGAPVDESA